MPKCFKLQHHRKLRRIGTPQFRCYLKSEQCIGKCVKDGSRCANNSVIGLPYCFVHLGYYLKVTLGYSRHSRQNAGKGVYAWNTYQERNFGHVFKKNEVLFHFKGEVMTRDQMNQRYGDIEQVSPPYAIQISANRFIDAACERHIAAMLNPPPYGKRANVRLAVARATPNKISVIALKNIHHGDELFIDSGDYGFVEQGNHKTYDCPFSRTWPTNYKW